ncbi:MAG: methyltransferase domain-containing protein [Nitrospiraceae bacterium]|nr:methyltransferase domain-containing protein [Nitrospiraceae bacterium]
MSTLVYMKMLEQTPAKYDRGMRLLTLGRIDRIKREIASIWVEPGNDVLEIGCGTGTLAALMTERGAHVLGIDVSEPMLAVARESAPRAEFRHMTATEIDQLGAERFDRIVATLSFSELSEGELEYVIGASAGILKPGGKLVVADEMPASRWWQRSVARLVRWPLAALTFLLTQNTTHALRRFEERLDRTRYRVLHRERYLLGTLALVVAEKA